MVVGLLISIDFLKEFDYVEGGERRCYLICLGVLYLHKILIIGIL